MNIILNLGSLDCFERKTDSTYYIYVNHNNQDTNWTHVWEEEKTIDDEENEEEEEEKFEKNKWTMKTTSNLILTRILILRTVAFFPFSLNNCICNPANAWNKIQKTLITLWNGSINEGTRKGNKR